MVWLSWMLLSAGCLWMRRRKERGPIKVLQRFIGQFSRETLAARMHRMWKDEWSW